MKNILKNPWTYFVLAIILIAGFYGYNSLTGGAVQSPGQYDDFADYLTEQGVKMYGTEWCSYCQRQKDLFGESFDRIDFVDCDKDRQECLNAGIKGYPTWKINEQNYPGLQSLERLAQLSRYEGDFE